MGCASSVNTSSAPHVIPEESKKSAASPVYQGIQASGGSHFRSAKANFGTLSFQKGQGPPDRSAITRAPSAAEVKARQWLSDLAKYEESLPSLEDSLGVIAEVAMDALRELALIIVTNPLLDGIGAALSKGIREALTAKAAHHNCRRLLGAMAVAVRSFDSSNKEKIQSLKGTLDRCNRLIHSYVSERNWYITCMAQGSSRRIFEDYDRELTPFLAHNAANLHTELGPYRWGPEDTVHVFAARRCCQLSGTPDVDVPTLIRALSASYRGSELLDLLPKDDGDPLIRDARAAIKEQMPSGSPFGQTPLPSFAGGAPHPRPDSPPPLLDFEGVGSLNLSSTLQPKSAGPQPQTPGVAFMSPASSLAPGNRDLRDGASEKGRESGTATAVKTERRPSDGLDTAPVAESPNTRVSEVATPVEGTSARASYISVVSAAAGHRSGRRSGWLPQELALPLVSSKRAARSSSIATAGASPPAAADDVSSASTAALRKSLTSIHIVPMVLRLSPSLLDLWNKSKDMFEDFAPWHRIRMNIASSVPFLNERVKQLPHAYGKDPQGTALQVSELLDRILRRYLDPDFTERVTPQDLLALPCICRGFLEQAALDGKEVLQFDGDEEGGLPWCLSLLRQCYAPEDLQQDRDKGLSELKYLLRPMPMTRDIYTLRAPFEPSTKAWFLQAFDQWYAAGTEDRCMLCTGPPGCGLTTASAELSLRRKQCIQAVLSCRRDQAERQNPPAIIRTLAFQLALSIPGLWTHVLKGARTLAVDADDTTLYTRLLEEPLLRLDREGSAGALDRRGLVILIEGLDEACSGPGPNPVSLLLSKLLCKLPGWVRFVLCSSTPSSEDPLLEPCIAALKPGTLVEVDVTQEVYKQDLRTTVESQVRPFLQDAHNQEKMQLVVNKILDRAKGSFVFVSLFVNGTLVPAATGTSRYQVQPIRSSHACDLINVFSDFKSVARTMLITAFAKGATLARRLLQVLTVQREPILLTDLARILDVAPESEAFTRAIEGFGPLLELQGPVFLEKRLRLFHRSIADSFKLSDADGLDFHALAREAPAFVVEQSASMVRQCLFGVGLTAPIASELPGYVVRHTVSHAIDTEDSPTLEEFLLDPRFLKVQAEERLLDGLAKEVSQGALRLSVPPGFGSNSKSGSGKRKLSTLQEIAQWLAYANLAQLHATPNAIYQAVLLAPRDSWVHRAALPLLDPLVTHGLPPPRDDESAAPKTLFALPAYLPEKLPEGRKRGVNPAAIGPGGNRNVIEIFRTTSRISETTPLKDASARPAHGHSESIQLALLSPDRLRCLTTSTDCTAIVWDLDNEHDAVPIHVLKGHAKGVVAAAWNSAGNRVVTGSIDGAVYVWNTVSGEMALRLPQAHNDMIIKCSFCPTDPTRFFSATLRSLSLWSIEQLTAAESPTAEKTAVFTLSPFKEETSQIIAALWSPDGKYILTTYSDGFFVWDGLSGARAQDYRTTESDGALTSVAWSPDSSKILAGTSSGRLFLYALDPPDGTSKVVHLAGHQAGIRCLAWSPDGSRALSGAFNSTLSMWDMKRAPAFPLIQEMQCPGARLECFFSSAFEGSLAQQERLLSVGNDPYLLIHDREYASAAGAAGANGTSATWTYVPKLAVSWGVLEPHVMAEFPGIVDPTFPTGSSVFGIVSYDLGRSGEVHVLSKLRFMTL